MKKWVIYLLIFISLLVIIFDIFVIMKINGNTENVKIETKKELAKSEEIDTIDLNIIETSYTSTKISPNAKLVFEELCLGCNHNIIQEIVAKEDVVNKNEYEISEVFDDWEIKKFSSDNVIFYKEVNKMCGNDYIIKEKDGFVCVFKISEDGNEELYEQTQLETKYLSEIDISELEKGIKVNGIEKVNKILEDYE